MIWLVAALALDVLYYYTRFYSIIDITRCILEVLVVYSNLQQINSTKN